MSEVSKLYATDDTFREVADLLFGGGADELIEKMNPVSSDLSTKKKEKTQAKIGLASNVVGIAAGTAGLMDAAGSPHLKHKSGTKVKLKPIRISRKTKTLAGAAVGLQALNLAGDAVANRVLSRAAKDTKKKIHKADCGMVPPTTKKGKLIRTVGPKIEVGAKGSFKKIKGAVEKNRREVFDVKWAGEISKVDADKQQVFGWASIVEMDGEPVVDLQGDYISIEEVEKCGYEYVKKSRKGGDMHLRDGDNPVHASDMIESFIVTPEKKKALGLPDELPTGWWVGYQVNDPDVWAKVKSGERTGFSIHGTGVRTPHDV